MRRFGSLIGIGGSLAAPPLPHHRTYGSVYGGSRSYANALRSNDSTRVGWAFPSVPMIMRHLSPKSLTLGRRTEITWLCQSETRSWMVPLRLTRREAGGRPLCLLLLRHLPNCRIGRAVDR